MSNRNERLKQALGLTVYPWSSDDEENLQSTSDTTASTSRRATDGSSSNVPESNGPPPLLSPTRRTPTRLERDLFCSLLNNRNRVSLPGSSRSSSNAFDYALRDDRIDLNSPSTNLKRILAIKRLSRLNSYRTFQQAHRASTSSRSRMITPKTHADITANLRISRVPPAPHPAAYIRSSIVAAVMDGASGSVSAGGSLAVDGPHVPPDDNAHSEDETDAPVEPASPAEQTNDDVEEQEQHPDPNNIETANTSGGQVVPEEEIVEMYRGGENNQPGDNASIQAQVSGDEDGNEESAGNLVSADSEHPHGVKRKRESQEENIPYTVKDFNQSLLRLLECPVCLEWMEPPMSQCRRGHLVCVRCRARLSVCPVCRTAFSSVRNRAMEGVAEMLRYPCRHGCGRETRLRRRTGHESSCAARRYRCPAPICAERAPLPLSELPQHFQTRHLPILKVGRRHQFSMKMNMEQHDNWIVMAARELFHLRVDVDIRTWGVVVYVAYIGPKCNANNYTYEVTVVGQHNERKLVYTRVTHSDLESSSLNVSRQDCFHLTLDQALNFLRYKNRHCEPDKFLDFVVEINKLEVPIECPREETDS